MRWAGVTVKETTEKGKKLAVHIILIIHLFSHHLQVNRGLNGQESVAGGFVKKINNICFTLTKASGIKFVSTCTKSLLWSGNCFDMKSRHYWVIISKFVWSHGFFQRKKNHLVSTSQLSKYTILTFLANIY